MTPQNAVLQRQEKDPSNLSVSKRVDRGMLCSMFQALPADLNADN